ncbi:Wadjet anti-phage system protein JetD domain-containing protein [Hymenobacter monticola]|uniref:DUF2220 family protein n=1 Tax=Hymenobacter monticola TaxID=1705399 RepID=A0ABY4B9J8_9BACT|nr:Wadjet anti-phage system protein JetD domain-containing protein [Hymenobacter monticola]UOE34438.1 DUF2220 family protein [Hymenobacter monticola]
MISLPELRAKAMRQYMAVLRAHLEGENIFPLPIRASKALDRTQGGAHIYEQLKELVEHSKNRTGSGYWLSTKPNRKTGQSEVSRIEFETRADFLGFIDKQTEFDLLEANARRTASEVPELLPLLQQTPRLLLDNLADWPGLLTVCAYFQANPQPNEYVRSLELPLPTKFVEQHQVALRPLLDWLIPNFVRAEETDFFRRFHLLLEEPGIKVRFLDAARRLHPAVSQCSVWASEFRQLNLPVRRVYIIENLTSFLAFPPVAEALAVWGGGFAVSLLAGADWLRDKPLFYWGDLDVHGFQILAQLRTHFPAAQSLLMDVGTFARYHGGGTGGNFMPQILPNLTSAEQQLYQTLLQTNARLEQEQLPPRYVAAAVQATVSGGR